MAEIIPAILPKNYEDLKNKIAMVRGAAPVIQVDFCDGIFVKNQTWPFLKDGFDEHFKRILNEQEGMPFWEDVDFELDLMVHDAVENFDVYTKLGSKRIIFHTEAVGDLEEFKNFLEGMDPYVRDTIQIGVAINPSASAKKIFPLINDMDFVQVMGIEKIGLQGEKMSMQAVERLQELKEKFPDLTVTVDGGVNFDTAPALINAGADRLIIGSAIFNTDDIISTIDRFRDLQSI